MNRRAFCTLALSAAACTPAPPKKPNILFCFADDWGRYASIYRDPARPGFNDVIDTPHIDRIGHEGVVYNNAFVAAPSCTPSRAAVTTGMYFFRCGRHSNLRILEWPDDVEDAYLTLPGWHDLLQADGYHVGHAGKTTSRNKGPRPQESYTPGQSPMSRFSQHASGVDEPALDKEGIYDEVRDAFRRFLADRPAEAPFVYWFGPHNPHRPWVRGSGKALWGIEPDSLKGKLPAFLPDAPEVREDVADYLGEVLAWDRMVGVLLEELEATGELDDTFIAVSGDHGMPGMPRGKCNVYDFGVHAPLLMRWPNGIKAAGRLDGFVNLMDLAPTMLEAAGLEPPAAMQARSLMPTLRGESGPEPDHVIVGRERHVPDGRPGRLPYPIRAIRTAEHLYIRNFKPDRWPMGDPGPITESYAPPAEELTYETMIAFKDLDGSPTKTWIITHRNDPELGRYYQDCFGLRPAEELYDLAKDPDQVNNVAGVEAYSAVQKELSQRLMTVLEAAGDPRLEDAFDRSPYVEALA